MCKSASFIVVKEGGSYAAFWSKKSDSHEVIKRENNLLELDKQDNIRGEYRMIPVEIVPPNDDYRLPPKKWVFKIDLSPIPEWADAKTIERVCRLHLKDWLAAKVVLPKQTVGNVNIGQLVAVYGKIKSVSGSAQIKSVSDSAQIKSVYGSAQIGSVSDSAQIKSVYGSAQIGSVYGSAQIEYVYDSAQIESVYGSAQIGSVYDSAQIGSVYDSAQIGSVYDSAQIGSVEDSALIVTYNNLSPGILKSSKAVMVDRSSDTVKCFIGKD